MSLTTQPESRPVHTSLDTVADYVTKDGSIIRELLHPDSSAVRQQSLAEARVAPGEITALHLHQQSEEIYHITQGQGRMRLGDREFDVQSGDSIVIAPGTPHCIRNTGSIELRILCACSPAYQHADTELL
jgi:mannose-6-phosphate isomerase-like protein (cupin superfamily)